MVSKAFEKSEENGRSTLDAIIRSFAHLLDGKGGI